MQVIPHPPGERRARLIIASIVACLAAYLFSYTFAVLDINDVLRTGLVSDVNAYERIGAELLNGAVPYSQLAVEHLPVSLLLVGALSWIVDTLGIGLAPVWVLAMAAAFVGSVVVIDSIDPDAATGRRFLLVSIPLLPLVLFRLEPWVVLLAALSIAAYAANDYTKGTVWTVVATLAKGWPITLLAYPWSRRRRGLAVGAVAISGALLAVVALSDGFQRARAFDGIHSETIVGNLVLVWRHALSATLGSRGAAGAVYVAVPDAAVIVNAIPGIVLFAVAVYAVTKREASFRDLTMIVGLSVLGIMLMSPLFSTQFIFWLAPFAAFASTEIRRVYILGAIFGLATVTVFEPQSFIWALEVLVKNVAIVWLAIVWTRSVLRSESVQDAKTSRRNLPV